MCILVFNAFGLASVKSVDDSWSKVVFGDMQLMQFLYAHSLICKWLTRKEELDECDKYSSMKVDLL